MSEEEELEKRVENFLKTVNSSSSNGSSVEPRFLEDNMPQFLQKENMENKISIESNENPANYSAVLPNFLSSYCPENKICLLPSEIAFSAPPPPSPTMQLLIKDIVENSANSDRKNGNAELRGTPKSSEASTTQLN